ncbi:MAG: carboxypeptidase regulatory-like domain-containing protein [Rhodothermales bacterium]
MFWLKALVCLLLLLPSTGAMDAPAQFATVRGRVTDQADKQPLPGAAIMLLNREDGTRVGTATDGNGYFILSRISPGRYVLHASFVGYVTATDTLDLSFDDHPTLDLRLHADEATLDEVVVESQRMDAEGSGMAGFETIRPSALARIPMPGVSADLASYLQTLPGVVVTGDRGGHLFVRGGTPTQNLVMIDGMPVFQPFHIVGFYSAFPADIVAYADVHSGGFGARYGGRLSSVIDVATRNGNKQRITGAASLAPFLGSLRLEFPLVPERVSVLASVRESVIERIAPEVLGRTLPYRFGDRFFKVHAFLSRTSSLSLTALRTFDAGTIDNTADLANELRWRNEAYGGHYIYLPEAYPALAQLRFFVSRLTSRYRPLDAPRRDASVRTFGLEAGFVYFLGPTEIHFGLFGHSYAFARDLGGATGNLKEFVTEGGLYVDAVVEASSRFRVEPGLRLHSFPSRSQLTVEPRLRVAWRPGGSSSKHIFSAAGGLYHQQIIGLYNARDVTDAFVTWSPSPEIGDIPRAMHLLAGWEGRVLPWLSLGVEAYHKALSHLAFAEYSEIRDTGISIDRVRGDAQGLDVKLEITRPAFYGSITYSLGSVAYERTVERTLLRDEGTALVPETHTTTERFPPPHDRRHQIHALGRITRGPYAVSVRWQFGSGLPFTPAAGFFDTVSILDPDDRGFRTRPGRPLLVTEGTLYTERLPAYHRLDVSLERRFDIRGMEATLKAAVINVYDRANIFDYDLFAGRRINQLPLIPSLGLNVALR